MSDFRRRIAHFRRFLFGQDEIDLLNQYIRESHDELRDQIDLFKSSLEVPSELVDEFHQWKAANPIPDEPLVSVCVATYNRAKLLRERCVASVLAQTYSNLELVIIGDGCTDETTDVMRAVGDARITFRNRPERGRYPEDPQKRWMVAGTYAVNEALALASGYFITHLDDDDEYTPDRLELLVRFCKENQADFVWHPFWRETVDGTWALNEAESFRHSRLTTSSVFYRSWFKRIGWDINAYRLAEPGDWNRFRKIKYVGGVSIRYPKPLLYHYREGSQLAAHPGSKS